MPVPDQVRDDGSGIQFRFLDPGFRRDDDSPQAGGMKWKILILSPSPADCKKLSIYSQHPSPKGEGTSGNPTASGWGIKKIKQLLGYPLTVYLSPFTFTYIRHI